MNSSLYALILAGGSGTRLWPKSRQSSPKHLLQLNTSSSMIRETVERIRNTIDINHIFVVTNQDQVQGVREDLPEIPAGHIVAEPFGRNTAWAMGLGAYYIAKENPDATIINLAADHVITDKEEFARNMEAAFEAANSGDFLVTIGIKPTFPHSGLGYIRIGEEKKSIEGTDVYTVASFTEKPDVETAKSFLASGQYYWNANLYTWRAIAIKQALQKHTPDVYQGLETINNAIGTASETASIADVYNQAQSVQIDKGVSEKADNLLMIPGSFDWYDIGDWGVLYDLKKEHDGANVVLGNIADCLNLDTKGSLIQTDKRLIATIGVSDLVIIDTHDALLICPRDRVQDVKKVVEQLKAEGKTKYL